LIGTPNRAQFDEWRRALPQPLATPAHYVFQGGKLLVAAPLPASVSVHDAYVFPITDRVVDYEGKQSFRRAGDWLVGELPVTAPPANQFDGVLAIDGERGLQFHAIPGPVPEGGTPIGGPGWNATLWAVLGGFVGGILLNLMPCVFPILALKALHLARAGENEKHARSDGLAYTVGAVVGTGALGVALLAIRAAGTEAGWAFQLQDPRTIMLLLLLATAITANLIGLLEVPVLGGAIRPAGGFGTGALAAFVATPCAGPFLGAALGTALLLPPAGSVLVFAALGLGLALPFLIVSFIPALRKLLPRPGHWMKRLQRFLAIPMGATAIACIWLLYRQAGPRGLVVALIAVAVLTALLIWYGFAQRREAKDGWVILPLAIAVVGLATWQAPARTIASGAVAGAERWSETGTASYVAQGKPAFVYFTADWCLTCKVNEEAAIDRAEVRDAFKQAGVKVLAGDWTNGDPAITRFLESRGRAGVPYYLWYAPGRPPEELPQILTPSMLISRAQAQAKR